MLPTYEVDHFVLDNAEELNQQYPDSFWIPDQLKRESLEVGALVKLIFSMEETEGSEITSVERMWVEVVQVENDYYVGKIDNDPYGSTCVKCGTIFSFKPCHVIDIYEEDS
ncbi:DUF2314 domain-containing protein [Shewanella sp. Isolate8]|uniref:DUF2314 domain-containing protein n=1 Tax=Shewanella sp. Isolate8 TaxID=2908529 RepID=UPI001EFDEDA0|nr:DUF2314 domain-containing protein [Shewanella sp. Isolate8]